MYCPCAAAVARRAWVSSLPPPSVSFHQPVALAAVSSPIPVAATTSVHVPAVSPSSIPVPGVPPVPAVVSSLVRDSNDCQDFVVFVFSDGSFSDLSNNIPRGLSPYPCVPLFLFAIVSAPACA